MAVNVARLELRLSANCGGETKILAKDATSIVNDDKHVPMMKFVEHKITCFNLIKRWPSDDCCLDFFTQCSRVIVVVVITILSVEC